MPWNTFLFDSTGLIKDAGLVPPQVLAFPTAEGYGATEITGGRGGTLYKVTNLNDSGVGSFRWAIDRVGPRIVVFEVSGHIDLQSEIRITDPNYTIAGQTSPGGILITGRRFVLQAGNGIIRHMRFKVGPPRVGEPTDTLDAAAIYGPGSSHPPGVGSGGEATGLFFDHCSFAYSSDECYALSYGASYVTAQWCFINQPCNSDHSEGNHAMGVFFSTGTGMENDMYNCLHHSIIAHIQARAPELQEDGANTFENFADVRNNVIYNYNGSSVGKTSGDARVNWVENYVKDGPNSNPGMFEFRHTPAGTPEESIYVFHNWGSQTGENDGDTIWNIAEGFSTTITTSESWRRLTPWPSPTITTTRMTPAYRDTVLRDAGATVPVRDSHDEATAADVTAGTGSIIATIVYPDDYPTFIDGSPPMDTSGDGIPDYWATLKGLNPAINNANTVAPNGYTWIENYINELAGDFTPTLREKAFPTAYGFGENATGGRGGTVYKVTNLNDSGAGSFREAVTAVGARYVVFEVSGWINLTTSIQIDNNNLTIAGQTSPGGIGTTGAPVRVHADDVIVRHMRFRAGSHSSYPKDQLDSFQIWGPDNGQTPGASPTTNVIIDHCTMGWGVDECAEMSYDVGDVTIQHCLFHEGLTSAGHSEGNHSMGLFIWGANMPQARITLYKNFLAHSKDRQPEVNIGIQGNEILCDWVNNVTYNTFGGFGQKINGNYIDANVVHNFVKAGPESNTNFYETTLDTSLPAPRADTLYVFGNMGQNRTQQGVGSEWLVGESWRFILQDEGWRKATPHSVPYTLTPNIMTPEIALQIASEAGVTVPSRDSVEELMTSDFAAGTGVHRANVTWPTDFPTYSGTAPVDTSGDGIPDDWAIANGLDHTQNNANGNDLHSFYTNLEMYINELAGDF